MMMSVRDKARGLTLFLIIVYPLKPLAKGRNIVG